MNILNLNQKEEIWKDVKGYEGLYKVSNLGRVKAIRNNLIRKPRAGRHGYLYVNLCKNGVHKTFKIHRLVALHFIENPNNHPMINHKDEIKTNNIVDNLEWCDEKYNVNYGTGLLRRAKTQTRKIIQYSIKGEIIKEWNGLREIKENTGFSQSSISQCCNKKYKTSYGFVWRYAPRRKLNGSM